MATKEQVIQFKFNKIKEFVKNLGTMVRDFEKSIDDVIVDKNNKCLKKIVSVSYIESSIELTKQMINLFNATMKDYMDLYRMDKCILKFIEERTACKNGSTCVKIPNFVEFLFRKCSDCICAMLFNIIRTLSNCSLDEKQIDIYIDQTTKLRNIAEENCVVSKFDVTDDKCVKGIIAEYNHPKFQWCKGCSNCEEIKMHFLNENKRVNLP